MDNIHKALLPAVIFILLLFPASSNAEITPLQVRAILPLTGKGASVGISIKNGMLMAYESFPALTRAKLELKFEDDFTEPRQSVSAAQSLVSSGDVDIIITAFSSAGNAVVPFTERANIPLLSLAYDRGISNGKKWAFTFWVNVDDLASAAVSEIERLGYQKVAIVSTHHEGNLAMRANLLRSAKGKVEFPVLEEIQLSDSDLKSQALRLKYGQPVDAVALLMHSAHLGLFVKDLRANGVNLPLFTLGNFEDGNVRLSARPHLKGQWYSAPEYSPRFLSAYKQKFPHDSTFGAAFGHDVILLLLQAGEKGIKRRELPEFLNSAKVVGGAFLEAAADGNQGYDFPVSIKVVGEDGID